MNVHDSERLSGLLEQAGYDPPRPATQADVVVFNTCAVRENADNQLYGNLGHLAPVKDEHPGMQIAVGGCLAQKDRGEIVRRAPWVDVVFGTHNIGSLPVLLERARHNDEAAGGDPGVAGGLPVDAAGPARVGLLGLGVDLGRLQQHLHVLHRAVAARQGGGPAARRHPGRGRGAGRRGRARGDPARPERQLLRRRVRRPARVRQAAARPAATIDGLERVRFTSPAPEGLHRRRHRRRWRRRRTSATSCTCRCSPAPTGCCGRCAAPTAASGTSAIIDEVRAAMPDAAITTDIIVGFPGETEADFQADPGRGPAARFSAAFTFQYSPAPRHAGRRRMADQVPQAGGAGALRAADRRGRTRSPGRRTGRWSAPTVEVLVADGEGRKDEAHRPAVRPGPGRPAGALHPERPRRHRYPAGTIRPGDVITTTVTAAAPHHLLADGGVLTHRRTRAGDRFEAGSALRTPGRRAGDARPRTSHGAGRGGVSLLGALTRSARPRSEPG